MNRYFFIGGFLGFTLLFAISIYSGASIHVVLRNAMVGCLLFAFFFHYYINRVAQIYLESRLRLMEEARQQERERQKEEPKS